MATFLCEHDLAGTIRYLIADGDTTSPTHRDIPIVSSSIEEIGAPGWKAELIGCRGCACAWAAVYRADADESKLECPRCGGRDSGVAKDYWCASCGHDWKGLPHPEAPKDQDVECPSCHEMRGVEA